MGRKKKEKIIKENPVEKKEPKASNEIVISFGDKNSLSICSSVMSKVSVRALEGEDTVLITLQGKIRGIQT